MSFNKTYASGVLTNSFQATQLGGVLLISKKLGSRIFTEKFVEAGCEKCVGNLRQGAFLTQVKNMQCFSDKSKKVCINSRLLSRGPLKKTGCL